MEFDAFFGPAFERAKATARRMGLDWAEAEDVALEALTRAYVRWHRLAPLAWREAWVLKVTANLSVDVLRRRDRAREEAVVEGSFESTAIDRLDLVRGLRSLPRRQRQVAVLCYMADLPEREVAAALRLREGTVKIHAHRARRRLRALLDEAPSEVEDE